MNMGSRLAEDRSDWPSPDHSIDASGLYCPEPVMRLQHKMRALVPGETLEVVATDPSTERDIPKFCQFLNHELLRTAQVDGRYHYLLRKGR